MSFLGNIIKGGWDALTGQGESKGKNKEERTPMAPTPDQAMMWDQFLNSVFGSESQAGSFDPIYYLKNNPDVAAYYGVDINNITDKDIENAQKHYEKYGKKEGRLPHDPSTDVDKSYKERLAEDIAYRKQADTGFVSGLGDLRKEFLDQLAQTTQARNTANQAYGQQAGQATNTYTDQLAKDLADYAAGAKGTISGMQDLAGSVKGLATSAPITISMGGFSTPFLTGSQRSAQQTYANAQGDINNFLNSLFSNQTGTAGNIYGANVGQAALINQLANASAGNTENLNAQQLAQLAEQLQAENQLANNFLPNQAENQFMDFITQLAIQQQGLRYGLPTIISSGSYNPPTNITAGIGDILNLIRPTGSTGSSGSSGGGSSSAGGAGASGGSIFSGLAPPWNPGASSGMRIL